MITLFSPVWMKRDIYRHFLTVSFVLLSPFDTMSIDLQGDIKVKENQNHNELTAFQWHKHCNLMTAI